MLAKTRAILFKTYKYSENSIVARFYTEEYGLESFIINNVRGKKSPVSAALLQPLNLLEADIYQRTNANLQRIKELKPQPILPHLYTDMPKTAAILFMQEVLNKVIVEKEKNPALFSFLFHHICWLDVIERLPGIYPTFWLVQLSRYLGFFPHTETWQPGYLFLPLHGVFSTGKNEPLYIDAPLAENIYLLCTNSLETLSGLSINAAQRRELLEKLLLYYRLHIEGFGELKSHRVLAEVFE